MLPKQSDLATHDAKWRGNWSPYIPRDIILRYSKEGDLVLDQFAGRDTTLVEATDKKLYAAIGKNIKEFRLNAGLTQVQLCDKTGISLSYLTKLESAKCDKSVSLKKYIIAI